MAYVTQEQVVAWLSSQKAAELTTDSGSTPDLELIEDVIEEVEGEIAKAVIKRTAVEITLAGSASRAQAAFSRNEGISTGVLVNSLRVSPGGQGNADTVFEVSADRVAIGSTVTYAAMRNFGGIIEPDTRKALAIPLTPALKRSGRGPRDIDPDRKLLRFQPHTGAKPNVFALLIDDAQPLTGRQRKTRGQTQYGPGPLFALAYWVRQEGAHFMGWDDEDIRRIEEDLLPEYLEG